MPCAEQAERLRVRRQLPHPRHNTEMLLNAGGFHSIISHFGPIIFMLAHLVGGGVGEGKPGRELSVGGRRVM